MGHAIRRIVVKAVACDEVVNIFAAAAEGAGVTRMVSPGVVEKGRLPLKTSMAWPAEPPGARGGRQQRVAGWPEGCLGGIRHPQDIRKTPVRHP